MVRTSATVLTSEWKLDKPEPRAGSGLWLLWLAFRQKTLNTEGTEEHRGTQRKSKIRSTLCAPVPICVK
jgi:hypothetical protein